MSKATLTYVINKGEDNENAILYLESGSLKYIDSCTKKYIDEDDLMRSDGYRERIIEHHRKSASKVKGQFYVAFIEDSDRKEDVPILFDNDEDIITTINIETNHSNEIEKARHLLWTSKDEGYLKLFLEEERLADTTFFNIRLSNQKEYRAALDAGLKPSIISGNNYLTIEEILQYKLETDDLGSMRALIEDALEVWKEKLFELDQEALYYYARHLRILENEYEKYLSEKKTVMDLDINSKNVYNIALEGSRLIELPVSGKHTYKSASKQKILTDDRKAA